MNATTAAPTPAGTIIAVDDKPENLNVLEALLTHAGYRTALFPRGELALAAAREEPPDLVLLDIRMPDMDGYEVCRRFKADERLRPIPIIFISALSATEDIAAGFACGGVDYITKPFREPELLARVHTHIALRAAYATLAAQHAQLQVLERHRDTLVHIDILKESSAGTLPAEDLDCLRAAIHGTHQLSRMVSTVVDLSRMETEKIPLHQAAVTVHEILHAALTQTCDPSSPRPLAVQIADTCPDLWCDGTLCTRIVANLLANALKYTPREREIVLGAAPDPDGVRIWVQDHGPGIPAQYHQRIFEKFGVADLAIDHRPVSTGLGLAFCKLAVEAHGGHIGVESQPGQGSTFWFTLPAAPEAAGI
ncbi:MAG: hybrid sensor histidine kinase/response regulator [bacterium]|nr:hybrid sensor histidine kinase/response regulator [bacterium]